MPTEKNNPFQDDKTQERIHKHLKNEEDVISNQDIDNVKTDIGETPPVLIIDSDIESPGNDESEMKGKKNKDDDDAPRIETPWNILS